VLSLYFGCIQEKEKTSKKINIMKFNLSLIKSLFILLFLDILSPLFAGSSSSDTLKIKDAVETVLQQYPSIKLSMEAVNAADAKIGLAKTGYYPDIDVSASYSRIGPVPSFDFPSVGHIQLYPENNYAASLNLQQNLYDFGKTSRRISVEQESKILSEQSVEIVKQQLTKRVISIYYTLLYIQEAIKIKDQQIINLREHLTRIIKKQETGSATDYEVLSTQVKLTAAESQKTDLESALNIHSALLNLLLGQPVNNKLVVSASTMTPSIEQTGDSIVGQALNNRFELKLANEREKLMQLRIELAKADNNPVLKFFVSAGGKNGYVPQINKIKGNYSAGIGLKIPLYDASRTQYNLSLAKTFLMSSQYEKVIMQHEITNEVVACYQEEIAALKKVNQSEFQVKQAQKAFDLANTSYGAGVITNLDLLDATVTLSESRLMLIKSKIDYLISYYGLQLAEGNQLFTEPEL
jgi:outer membrane protein